MAEDIDAGWIEGDLEDCDEIAGRRPGDGELDQSITNPSTRIDR